MPREHEAAQVWPWLSCPRKQCHGGPECGVAHHELQVLHPDEEQPKRGKELDQDGECSGAEAAVAEQARVEHGVRGVKLPNQEDA